jgi:hypothetical protein
LKLLPAFPPAPDWFSATAGAEGVAEVIRPGKRREFRRLVAAFAASRFDGMVSLLLHPVRR